MDKYLENIQTSVKKFNHAQIYNAKNFAKSRSPERSFNRMMEKDKAIKGFLDRQKRGQMIREYIEDTIDPMI